MSSIDIRANGPEALVVFADDWGRHPSSCQHLVRRLRDHYRILWVNSIGTRRPQWNKMTARRIAEKLRNWRKGLQQVHEQMWVLDLPMLPTMGNRLAEGLNRRIAAHHLRGVTQKLGLNRPVVLTTLPYVLGLIEELPRRSLLYYVTDDYSHWPGADRDVLQRADAEISRQADLVLPVSHALMTRYQHAVRCEYFPHGVEWDHFAQCDVVPVESVLRLPRPRIGFFGLIYEKLDFDLLSAVARHFATGSLVMIGPVDYCPDAFAAHPNVHFPGKKEYAELPAWIAGLDALLLPYVTDEMIRQSGPLKLRECLATGKPTVSVDVPEVRFAQPHVRVARSIGEFLSHLELALAEDNDQLAWERRSSVRGDGWECRAEQLRGWIDSFLRTSSGITGSPTN